MAKSIDYKLRQDINENGRAKYVEKRSYVPTIEDARRWDDETDQFVFVEDLLELSLDDDGESYVSRLVDRVEVAFEKLLSAELKKADKEWMDAGRCA